MENKNIRNERRKKLNRRKRAKRRLYLFIVAAILVMFLMIFIIINAGKFIINLFNKGSNNVGTEPERPGYTENPIVKESEEVTTGKDTEEEEDLETKNEEKINQSGIYNEFANTKISEKERQELLDNLPESLREMTEKYAETESTLIQYNKYKDYKPNINLEEDLAKAQNYDRKVKLPYFNQWDKRWGFNEILGDYFAVIGCGPTTLSMLYTGLTHNTDMNPYEMGEYARDLGLFDLSGSYVDLFVSGAQSLGLNSLYISQDEEVIKSVLNEGKAIVALVKYNGIGDFTRGGHYILLTEVTDDGKVLILDPNSYINTNKAWDIQRILDQTEVMVAVWN